MFLCALILVSMHRKHALTLARGGRGARVRYRARNGVGKGEGVEWRWGSHWDVGWSKVAGKPVGPFEAISHHVLMMTTARVRPSYRFIPLRTSLHSLSAQSHAAAASASSMATLSFGSRAYFSVSGSNVKFGSRMIDLDNKWQCHMTAGSTWYRQARDSRCVIT